MKQYFGFVAILVLACVYPSAPLLAVDLPKPSPDAVEVAPEVLRFDISGFTVDGAMLLTKEEIDKVVAPFVGKSKDFSDVQRALEAVEELYALRGFSAVRLLLPEQELEKGAVHFQAIEGKFGKVVVKDNKFVSESNAMNAIPSVRSGAVPMSKQIARELKLANENPARQLNVVLKAGENDDEVDASVLVSDAKPAVWGVTFDNTGSKETGKTRLGVSYRHANLFDKDHVGSLQFQTSPEHPSRVMVMGGSYKIPRYDSGDIWEFFGGYSNVNSLVGGLDNFKGGGLMLSARDHWMLDRVGGFDPRLTFGVDWRTFYALKKNDAVMNNEVVATPLSITLSASHRTPKSDTSFNLSYAKNLPLMTKGKSADYANYTNNCPLCVQPDVNYSVIRYGASYTRMVADEWQLRAAMNGQWSDNHLILGEQIRLGGADGVRGFSEGSEGGESGMKINLEAYTPSATVWAYEGRALAFYDQGSARSSNGTSAAISSAGVGLRANSSGMLSFRADMGWIQKAGSDPLYKNGDWRIHTSMSLSF